MAQAKAAVAANPSLEKNPPILAAQVPDHRLTIQAPKPTFGRASSSPFFIHSSLQNAENMTLICRHLTCLWVVGLGIAVQSSSLFAAQIQAVPILPAKPIVPAKPAAANLRPEAPAIQDAAASAVEAGRATPASSTNAANSKQTQERIKKLQQLNFDRRPSIILKAWSTPAEPDEPENKDADNTDETTNEESREEESGKELTEEEKAQREAAAKAAKLAQEATAFDQGLKQFQRNVTLGDWPAVKQFLASLNEEEQKVAYRRLLQSLRIGPNVRRSRTTTSSSTTPPTTTSQSRAIGARYREKNSFSFADIIGLVEATPIEIEQEHLIPLGVILQQVLANGYDVDLFVDRLREEVARPEEEQLLSQRQCALLLFAAGRDLLTGEFLPSADEARENDDREGLNLLSRHALAMHAAEKKTEHLETAWHATQAALAVGAVDEKTKEEALKRAVDLAPQIREELGQAWLQESFVDRIDRGKEILAAIGVSTSTNMQNLVTNAPLRLKALTLQKTAVDALLELAPDHATEFSDQLTTLAENWLREANLSYSMGSKSSNKPQMRRDPFGNIYYINENQTHYRTSRPGQAQTIATGDILDVRPDENWLGLISPSIKPRFDYLYAQLFLKVNEEEQAFPYIEYFASSDPEQALELAQEFLRVWTRNHNPNNANRKTNYYMYMYGFERRANQIPLTRSKQQRNLQELTDWVSRLRALPIGDLDETLLVEAFTTCHSSAEVYQLESLEQVFGSIDSLKPETLAQMVQQMRRNLAGIWRDPAEQKKRLTNRKQRDLEAEVQRGYVVAQQVLEHGLEKYPNDWRMALAKASMMHDQNDYDQELQKSSDFSKRRQESMDQFQNAAKMYIAQVGDLSESEETATCFETWFYASLGAIDLGRIQESHQPDLRQIPLIQTAIQELEGPASERHLGKFANSLFTRLSAVKPELKYRYLRNGFEITGDHPQAKEARKVFDYYNDLVTEIKLVTRIDGSDIIGHEQPFGLFVDLVHTKELERESGGFQKYLQNQNNQSYAYNYGRPTENYRDKFEEAAVGALQEQFEVLSVTFNHGDSSSKATAEEGWRTTHYAYLLLKARGPEVDKIPPLKIDLDFLDTSGFAILPIASSTLPVDAKGNGDARPTDLLSIVQTLDERQSEEGKLVLEIKGTAHGLVPDLNQMLAVEQQDFVISEIDDGGVSVSQFDKERNDAQIVSERIWTVKMEAKDNEVAKVFTFPSATIPTAEIAFQRYDDADLIEVESSVSLQANYAATNYGWLWVLATVGIGIVGLAWAIAARSRRPETTAGHSRFQMPEEITPFSVLGLLHNIEHDNGLQPSQRDELNASIKRIESHYFDKASSKEPDLKQIAEIWIRQAK